MVDETTGGKPLFCENARVVLSEAALTELLAAAEEAIGTITQAMTDNYLKSLGHPTVSQETRMRYTSRIRAAVARVRGE